MTPASRPNPSASCTPLTAVAMARVPPAIAVPGCGSKVSSWLGPPASQTRMIDRAGSGGLGGDPLRGVERVGPGLVLDERTVHQEQTLWDGAGSRVELVLTRVAVTTDEVPLIDAAEQLDEDVRVVVDRLQRRRL